MEKRDRRLDTDRVFRALGNYGRYQMQSFTCANGISIFLAMQVMQMAFINDQPKFYCTNESVTDIYNDTNQPKCYENITGEPLKCGHNGTYFKYDMEYGTSIGTEFNLVCNKAFLSSFTGSIFMFGVMVGAAVISQLSDTFGRRWLFLLSTWLLFISSFSQGFAPNYIVFAFSRFVTGVLYSGMGMVGWVISCENVTVSMRSYLSIVGGIFWSIGYMLIGLMAYLVRDWRMLSIYLSLPTLLSISFYWLVPETLHWYIAVGKDKEAEEWIVKAAKCNKVKVNIEECYTFQETDTAIVLPSLKKKKNFLDLVKSGILFPQTLAMYYLWICNAFVYFGLSLFSTQLSGDRYMNFILSGLVEVPSYFVAAFAMEKLGRRMTSVIFHFIAGLSLLALAFVPEKTESGTKLIPLIMTLSLIGKFAISVTFMAVFLFAAEIFPTTVRTVGIGSCSMLARVGAILAPYVGWLNEIDPRIVPAIFGTMALVASALTLVIAESKDMPLPEDLCDVRASKLQMILCPCFIKPSPPKVDEHEKFLSVNS